MEKKMTKNDYFNLALSLAEVQANPELVNFFNHEKELLAKKSAKPSKNSSANEAMAMALYAEMPVGEQFTAGSVWRNFVSVKDCTSGQKVVSILKILLDKKLVERTEVKGVAYFSKVG